MSDCPVCHQPVTDFWNHRTCISTVGAILYPPRPGDYETVVSAFGTVLTVEQKSD
jgi:hypothetical protein